MPLVTRPPVPTWATALLVALPCSVLASLLTLLVVQREKPAVPQPAPGEVGEVLRELAELQRRVDERLAGLERSAAATDSAAPPPREQVHASPPDIERLASLVERLTAVLAQQPVAGALAPVPRHLPVNHAALAELHALAQRDREAARRSTMLLTAEELLARYGLPDEVGSNGEHGIYWKYCQFGPEDERKGGTFFYLKEGRVVWHDISIPD